MKLKSILAASIVLCPLLVLAGVPPREVSEQVRDAGNAAITRLVERFVKEEWGESLTSFVIMPIQGDIDRGYFSQRLQDEFARMGRGAGYDLHTRQDEDVEALIEEVAMGIEKGHIMDPETVAKFKVVGAEAVIFTRIDYSDALEGETLRFNLEPYVVESRRRLVGGEEKAFVAKLGPRTLMLLIIAGSLGGLLLVIIILRAIYAGSRPR